MIDKLPKKNSITHLDSEDRDLSGSMAYAERLEILKENNNHHQTIAPIKIAQLAMILGIIITIGCEVAAYFSVGNASEWFKQAERAFAFSLAALSFIFGRSGKN